MRDIKFRGKRIDIDEWVYGSIIESLAADKYFYHIQEKDSAGYRYCHKVELDTVGQYTGLRDKNGVEIYEGDIVFSNTIHAEEWEEGSSMRNYVIGFHLGTFCFTMKGEPVRQWKDGINDWYSIENNECFLMKVVGNIHENPELIEK